MSVQTASGQTYVLPCVSVIETRRGGGLRQVARPPPRQLYPRRDKLRQNEDDVMSEPVTNYLAERIRGWESQLQGQVDAQAPGRFKISVTYEQYWQSQFTVTDLQNEKSAAPVSR
mgnify:CR=1 FL=1